MTEEELLLQLDEVNVEIAKLQDRQAAYNLQISSLLGRENHEGTAEGLVSKNRQVRRALQEARDGVRDLQEPLRILKARAAEVRHELWQLKQRVQVENFNKKMFHLRDLVVAYNEGARELERKRQQILRLYQLRFDPEYTKNLPVGALLKKPIAGPAHLPPEIKEIRLWNDAMYEEVRNGLPENDSFAT